MVQNVSMRLAATALIFVGMGVGCAHQHEATTISPVYGSASAGALAFDPPVISDQPQLALGREVRTPGAFVGYESVTANYYYLRIDDRQTDDNTDRYERRVISEKVGVTYR